MCGSETKDPFCPQETENNNTVHSHPERAVVGGAEHFGLVGGGDDGEGINSSHMTGQCPHLLFRLDVPHLDRGHKHLHHRDRAR